ncbi:hypothetical protein CLOM_g4815 [Closterium sp. NIES-68]|nr:hypothetical protein CLOM_g4815 [Closterium sp. NIES-68]
MDACADDCLLAALTHYAPIALAVIQRSSQSDGDTWQSQMQRSECERQSGVCEAGVPCASSPPHLLPHIPSVLPPSLPSSDASIIRLLAPHLLLSAPPLRLPDVALATSPALYLGRCRISPLTLSLTLRISSPLPLDTTATPLSLAPFHLPALFSPPAALVRALLAHYITEVLLCAPRVLASHHLLLNPLGLLHSMRCALRDLLLLPIQGSIQGGTHGLLLGVGRGGLSAWRHVSRWTVSSVSGFSSSVGRIVRRAYLGGGGVEGRGGSRGPLGEAGHSSGTSVGSSSRGGAVAGGGAAAGGSSGGSRGGGGVAGGVGVAVGHRRLLLSLAHRPRLPQHYHHHSHHRQQQQQPRQRGHGEGILPSPHALTSYTTESFDSVHSSEGLPSGNAATGNYAAGDEGARGCCPAETGEGGGHTPATAIRGTSSERGTRNSRGGGGGGGEGRGREGEGRRVSLLWQLQQRGVRCAASHFMPPLWPARPHALYLAHVDASTAVITTTSVDVPPLLLCRPVLLLSATHLLAVDQSGLGMAACLPLCGLEVSVERGDEGRGEELQGEGRGGEVEEEGSVEGGEEDWSLTCFCAGGGQLCGSVREWWETLQCEWQEGDCHGGLARRGAGERRGSDEGGGVADDVADMRGSGGESVGLREAAVQGGEADGTMGLQVYCQLGEAAHIQLVALLLRQMARSSL